MKFKEYARRMNNSSSISIVEINCRSLRSERKRTMFSDFVETNRPDVICGCESHLDFSYYDSEVFWHGSYDVLRKDRSEGGGGVFILVKKNLDYQIISEANTNCEIVWVKIKANDCSPDIFIGSFYRPPDSNAFCLDELEKSLSYFTNKERLPKIILVGDFNMPSIDWKYQVVKDQPQYGRGINDRLLDISRNKNMKQINKYPTREENILDISLVTHPDDVKEINIIEGISDHQALEVIITIDVKRENVRKKIVPLWNLADDRKITEELYACHNRVTDNNLNASQCWVDFKNTTHSLMENCVPKRTITNHDLPWVSVVLKKNVQTKK